MDSEVAAAVIGGLSGLVGAFLGGAGAVIAAKIQATRAVVAGLATARSTYLAPLDTARREAQRGAYSRLVTVAEDFITRMMDLYEETLEVNEAIVELVVQEPLFNEDEARRQVAAMPHLRAEEVWRGLRAGANLGPVQAAVRSVALEGPIDLHNRAREVQSCARALGEVMGLGVRTGPHLHDPEGTQGPFDIRVTAAYFRAEQAVDAFVDSARDYLNQRLSEGEHP